MADLRRRRFLQSLAMLGGMPLAACQWQGLGQAKARVVVVGGGFAGATTAKTLRLLVPSLQITLVEPKAAYFTCPASNWLLGGLATLSQLAVDYRALQDRYGISVVNDSAERIEAEKRRVRLAGGGWLNYDRLILAPGIDFLWDKIAGYGPELAESFPHAWQAGRQTELLARQLQAMPDGGTAIIVAPDNPYRCPPGPYERASMMAHWCKRYNPRAKVLILDPKRSFSKQALFEAAWAKQYGYGTANSMIEWHCLADNPIVELDAKRKTVVSEFGDRFAGDVLNIIPQQQAGAIAFETGLADGGGWCSVRPESSVSVFDPFIHVIGDAANYAPIPKSAFAANSEAKACALAVVSLLQDRPLPAPHWLNTCYSLVSADYGISVSGVYRLNGEQGIVAVEGAGGVGKHADQTLFAKEAEYARAAYRSLCRDGFGF